MRFRPSGVFDRRCDLGGCPGSLLPRAFGVSDTGSGVDLVLVGYICMGAGALAVILSLIVSSRRTRSRHTTSVQRRKETIPGAGAGRDATYVERRDEDDTVPPRI